MENTGTSSTYTSSASGAPQMVDVVVRDIQMSFGSMVVFILKWVLASIPAMIILSIIGMLIAGVIGVMFGGAIAGLSGLGG